MRDDGVEKRSWLTRMTACGYAFGAFPASCALRGRDGSSLIQQQEVRLAEQQFRQRDAHLPSAREGLGGPEEVVGREAEALEHGRGLELDGVAVVQPETILQVAVARQHLVVLHGRNRRIAKAVFEACIALMPTAVQALEVSSKTVRPACVKPSCRRQPTVSAGSRMPPASGSSKADHRAKQHYLAGAVRPAEAGTLSVVICHVT
jgi:hypothetical protein